MNAPPCFTMETSHKHHETPITQRAEQLVAHIAEMQGCLVAFSGGVDSAVVAKAAHLALGDRAVAVTGTSASLATGELEAARTVARNIGIRHEVIDTGELDSADYRQNAPDRCWHCKNELYSQMLPLARRLSLEVLVSGANADDLGDFRPGMDAATEHQVRSPLVECDLGKEDVRALARYWRLSISEKPATPCLSSRVVYGLEVTADRLARIDAAEQFLRSLGLETVRVRYHQDDLARIELSPDEMARVSDEHMRREIGDQFRALGFRFVTLDLEGFRSGSFQSLVDPEQLSRRQIP